MLIQLVVRLWGSFLMFANSHLALQCLSVLLKRVPKGEADEPDDDQMTPLHWSASYGNAEHVKLLLKAGAAVTLPDLESKYVSDNSHQLQIQA